MPVPYSVQDVINQIIATTDDVTPELHQPMVDELQEQFEALVAQTIIKTLPASQAIAFRQMLEESTNPKDMEQFLNSHVVNMDQIIHQATIKLKQLYLN